MLVSEQVTAEIRRRIMEGVYGPGEYMPTERAMAHEFATSRSTISRAFTLLAEDGLIEATRGRGTRVIPLAERKGGRPVGVFYIDKEPLTQKPGLMIKPVLDTLAAAQQHARLILGNDAIAAMTPDLISGRFCGAIFIEGLGYEEVFPELVRRNFPVVVANLEKEHRVACTWVDHAKTTETAVRLLAALGHRRIALLTRPRELFFYEAAFNGYRRGLAACEIDFDPELVVTVRGLTHENATAQVASFLPQQRELSAIVACRDYLAGGACQAAEGLGMKVGYDLSVIGFDDTTWPQEPPFLTTFREPIEALGGIAARMLLEQLLGATSGCEQREVAAPLVMRRSAGPAPFGVAGPAINDFLIEPWSGV